MANHAAETPTAPGFSEREFYRSEFRGRTLAIALPGLATGPAASELEQLDAVLAELAANGTRVVLLAPSAAPLAGRVATELAGDAPADVAGRLWRALRREGRVGIVVPHGRDLAAYCRELALRLRLAKLLWVDTIGPLRDASGARVSWVDAGALDDLLEGDGALAAGAAERRSLLREVRAMVVAGLPAVNLCTYAGLSDELFTFEGSGTFFARERYLDVRPLALDEFDAADALIRRGVAEGFLVARSSEQLEVVLAHAFGAFVEGRYLAGVGALVPVGDAAEICSLYTLTRFVGEGIGGDLVRVAVEHAAASGLASVFACTTSARVEAFFRRHGFETVGPDRIPASKWAGYPPERRPLVRCLARKP